MRGLPSTETMRTSPPSRAASSAAAAATVVDPTPPLPATISTSDAWSQSGTGGAGRARSSDRGSDKAYGRWDGSEPAEWGTQP